MYCQAWRSFKKVINGIEITNGNIVLSVMDSSLVLRSFVACCLHLERIYNENLVMNGARLECCMKYVNADSLIWCIECVTEASKFSDILTLLYVFF